MNPKDFFEIDELTKHLFSLGWAERNGGNISIRLDNSEYQKLISCLSIKTSLSTYDFDYSMIKETIYLLITVSGSRFRNLHKNVLDNIGILVIDPSERNISWFSVSQQNLPSSEWLSHLNMHAYLKTTAIDKKCILHTHPTELIALSHKFYDKAESELNQILWSMMPEVKIFVPQGLGLVPLLEAGSEELAQATTLKLIDYSVILWAKHGCLALGNTLWETFEYIDILNKAAKIYLLAY